jgi:hypothetical protein
MGWEHLPGLAGMLPEKTADGCLFRKQKRPDFNVLPRQAREGAISAKGVICRLRLEERS